MDKRTVFADKLVLPRAIKVLDSGVLVGEPPNLWLMKDTDGDLKADTKELVSDTYGRAAASIEHNANSLFWALDNVIYTSEHDWHLRLEERQVRDDPDAAPRPVGRLAWTTPAGSSGTSTMRRCSSTSSRRSTTRATRTWCARAASTSRCISREASTVWPMRATRGVNRGYRDQFFRPDDSSVTIQGVGTPVVYRGDRLPKELYGDAFITDSPTNLVHRYKIVDDGTGRLKAVDGYEKGEILASWDERFRPVNLLGGPDGTLYVVDMYRGDRPGADLLDRLPARLHQGARPGAAGEPRADLADRARHDQAASRRRRCRRRTPAQLVEALSHPNGWWRDTAQQLLVQRGDKSVVPQLKQLAAQAPDWRTRLHALWTLDGLDAIEPDDVQRALADKSPDVRASAIRLSERWLDRRDAAAGGGRCSS